MLCNMRLTDHHTEAIITKCAQSQVVTVWNTKKQMIDNVQKHKKCLIAQEYHIKKHIQKMGNQNAINVWNQDTCKETAVTSYKKN